MSNTSKEAILERFIHAVDVIVRYRRHGIKNESQLAKAIGAIPQNMSKYRNGTQGVSLEQVARLCDIFGINDSYIMRGVGNLEEMMPLTQRMDQLEVRLIELEKQVELVLSSKKK